jgi:hypothetical protein
MNDILYPNTCEVEFKGKKPKSSWMKDWSLETRIDKFFEFCHKFDDRKDNLLNSEYQIFSHRLHWHEHPFCEVMQKVTNNRDRLFLTLVFSFTNEHWGTFTKLMNEGIDETRAHFMENRHARNDLFQIYYPKGTNVKEWILDGPLRAAEDLQYLFDDIESRSGDFRDKRRPYTMMEFAKKLEAYFKAEQGFRSPLYPCKNTARYIAMSYPHLADPETILFGGTGHFDGLHQIFDGQNLNGKVKYSIDSYGHFVPENKYAEAWLSQMKTLVEHPSNPMKSQKYLNIEDKTCFFWKHIAITHGEKKPTKNIPYTWIFPDSFSLSGDADFLMNIEKRELMY